MAHSQTSLPEHDRLSGFTRLIELSCIVCAVFLLILHAVRLWFAEVWWCWWSPGAIVAGLFAADFASGLIHWTADTWGTETMPVLGRRFVRPFRVHHVNPNDFLHRDFIDTNGDVAGIVSAFLVVLLWLPLQDRWGQVSAVFLWGLCLGGLPTNQVHQWAHMRRPPRWIMRLQQAGILLDRAAHRRHHRSPFVDNYCIATGWCNSLLMSVQFFRRLEQLVTFVTGLRPRLDDQAFATRVEEGRTACAGELRPGSRASVAESSDV